MSTISFRLDEEDYNMLQTYVSANGMQLSSFVREAIMDKIEDSLNIDEDRILKAYNDSFKEQSVDHAEVWKKLGV